MNTENTKIKLNDTVITTAGVYRCCIQTVGMELEQKEFSIGQRSRCPHCQTEFTLVSGKPEGREDFYIWLPNWQIKEDGDPQGVL